MQGMIDWRRRVALGTIFLLAAAPAMSRDRDGDDDEEIPFSVAEIFFELNDTDGDLGVHALIDGEAWRRVKIEDPRERKMLDVRVRGRLGRQGLTELFFESAEPNFDDLEPEVFFARFPAGEYEVEGRTLDRRELESETELTHVLPAPPDVFNINGMPALPDGGEECDEEELPEISHPIVVQWSPVTKSHPELGVTGVPVEVIRYRLVAEYEDEAESVFVSSIDVAPDELDELFQVTLPEEFGVDEAEVKFEILIREASFNQTALESCPFELDLEDDSGSEEK